MSETAKHTLGGRLKAAKITTPQQAVTFAAASAANEHEAEVPQVRAGHIRIATNKAAKEFDRTHVDEPTADEPTAAPPEAKAAKAKTAKSEPVAKIDNSVPPLDVALLGAKPFNAENNL